MNENSSDCCDSPKPCPTLPAAWVYVEAAANGWCVFVKDGPRPDVQPDFVFNSVTDCARKVAELLRPGEFQEQSDATTIRKMADALLIEHGNVARLKENLEQFKGMSDTVRRQADRIKELNNDVILMAAGRDQDRVEAKERCAEYQIRLEEVWKVSEHREDSINGLLKELDKQKAGLLVEANRRADAEAKLRDLESPNTSGGRARAYAYNDGVESIRPALQEANKRISDLINENAKLRERKTALEIQTEEILVREIRVCVDGKFYTIDDLCKEHSLLKLDMIRWKETAEGWRKDNATLTEYLKDANTNVKSSWKRGFDAGRDQTMKFVSNFCKEQTERLHGLNPNLSGLS